MRTRRSSKSRCDRSRREGVHLSRGGSPFAHRQTTVTDSGFGTVQPVLDDAALERSSAFRGSVEAGAPLEVVDLAVRPVQLGLGLNRTALRGGCRATTTRRGSPRLSTPGLGPSRRCHIVRRSRRSRGYRCGTGVGQNVKSRPEAALIHIYQVLYESGRRDSNPRPSPWQGDALPAEPRPRCCWAITLATGAVVPLVDHAL
jgi:hypothetical protein